MVVISVDRKLKGVEKIINSLLNRKIICVFKHLAALIQIVYLSISSNSPMAASSYQ